MRKWLCVFNFLQQLSSTIPLISLTPSLSSLPSPLSLLPSLLSHSAARGSRKDMRREGEVCSLCPPTPPHASHSGTPLLTRHTHVSKAPMPHATNQHGAGGRQAGRRGKVPLSHPSLPHSSCLPPHLTHTLPSPLSSPLTPTASPPPSFSQACTVA